VALALVPLVTQVADAGDPIPADGETPVRTASGLVYSVLTPGGKGPAPKTGDTVTVHYTGWLTNGKIFDSSRQRGEPASFPVGGLIPGWNEALALMTPGARWKLTIPAELGYGAQGSPPTIPPNSTLIFDVELIRFRGVPVFRTGDPARQTTTPSGLVMEMLDAGQGEVPGPRDEIELDFAFWTTAGKLVDSSVAQGRPIKASRNALRFPFMKEALEHLKPGGRVWLKVPAALAFGDKGYGQALPPGAESIWELTLVSVKAAPPSLPCPPFQLSAPGAAKKLPSGLEIEVLAEGTGKTPRRGEDVTVHYAGWLPDGTLFDSSYERGEPAVFKVGSVIQGWNEALGLMKEGSKVRLRIPGDLAYGPAGTGDKIGPNATLIFYIELLKVGK
jgi:FKBP-type peptidyl-prolyl cis-trans isomerase